MTNAFESVPWRSVVLFCSRITEFTGGCRLCSSRGRPVAYKSAQRFALNLSHGACAPPPGMTTAFWRGQVTYEEVEEGIMYAK